MLITTSRRPCHKSRVLGRELASVVSNSRYLPRGTKTVEELADLARKFGQSRIMVVGSVSGRPAELRFLEVGEKWGWMNVRILLGRVELQRELGKRVKLEATEVCAREEKMKEFARVLGALMGLPPTDEPGDRAAILVGSGEKILIQFWDGKSELGPKLHVKKFEKLYLPCDEENRGEVFW